MALEYVPDARAFALGVELVANNRITKDAGRARARQTRTGTLLQPRLHRRRPFRMRTAGPLPRIPTSRSSCSYKYAGKKTDRASRGPGERGPRNIRHGGLAAA
ncbi:MAG: hypothetical protein WDN72_08880 [Alphaproteobacteria bacterium]